MDRILYICFLYLLYICFFYFYYYQNYRQNQHFQIIRVYTSNNKVDIFLYLILDKIQKNKKIIKINIPKQ